MVQIYMDRRAKLVKIYFSANLYHKKFSVELNS